MEEVKRVYIVENEAWKKKKGSKKNQVRLAISEGMSIGALCICLSSKCSIKVTRVYFDDGSEIQKPTDIMDGDLLIVSSGESFGETRKDTSKPIEDEDNNDVDSKSNSISFSFRSSLCIIPPKDVWDSIQAIRALNAPNMKRWFMPHINLFFPFLDIESDELVLDDLKLKIKKSLQEFSTFTIYFNRIAYFSPKANGMCTVYLVPETQPTLDENSSIYQNCKAVKKLQSKLAKAVGIHQDKNKTDSKRRKNKFTPHLSLGEFSGWQIEQTVEELQREWKPIHFEVTDISLLFREKGSGFETVATFGLPPRKDKYAEY